MHVRLKTRLLLIALAIVIPAIGVISYDQTMERQASRQRTRDEMVRVAQLAADQQSGLFREVQSVLGVVAALPGVRASAPDACNAALPKIVEQSDVDIIVVDGAGRLFCYGRRPDRDRFDDRSWFKRAAGTRAPAIGDYQRSSITGRPVIVVAAPLLDPDGAVVRVVAAALSLDRFNALVSHARLPGTTSVMLVNRERRILAHYPDPARWIGHRITDTWLLTDQPAASNLLEDVDVDGVRRMFAVAPVAAGLDSGLFVVMGVDPAAAFADNNRLLVRHLALLGLVTLIGVAAAGAGGHLFLVRPAEHLKRVAARIAKGDLTARAEPTPGVAEFNEVGEALNAMGVELHARHEQLRTSEERYRLLFEHNPRPLWVYDVETLQFLAVNDAAIQKYGYSRAEFLSMTIADIRPADDVPRLLDAMAHWQQSWDRSNTWHHRLKSGAVITVEISSHSFGFDGREARLVAATDVTKLIEATQALTERAATSTLSAQVGASLIHEAPLADCLSKCASAIVENLDAALVRIWTTNTGGDVLELQASAGMYTHVDGGHQCIRVGEYKIGRIAETRMPHLTNNVVGDPQVPDQEWAEREHIVSFAGYPMIVGDRLVGVLGLFSRHALSDVVLSSLGAIANHIALGVTRRRLEDSRRLLASIVEASDDAIVGADLQGTIMTWNSGASALYGYTAEQAVGQHMSLIVAPDRRPELDVLFARVLAADPVRLHETTRRRSDSSAVNVSLTLSPILNDSQEIVGVSEIARDITARRQAELALRAAEERMRIALESAHVGVWDSNLQTNKVYWSEICAKMHGVTAATFGGTEQAFAERIHPDDRTRVLQLITTAARKCSDVEFDYRTVWEDGSVHSISASAHFSGDGGPATRATGIAIDITERRSLEDQLRQAQKMEAVGQLAGGIAHDFNNMLTAILGYAELLEGAFRPGDRALADLEQIKKSGERAAALTRQLLAFSRRQILQPTIVDVNAVVADLGNLLQRLIGEDIRLDLKLDPAIDRITADAGQLEQVIVNIAVNARDAMPDGGTLTITTDTVDVSDDFFRRQGIVIEHDIRRFMRLSITDTGVGMDEQTRRRIFEPFFTTKPKGRGTGLGLATVYGIVKQSGGFVFVESAPSKGARFDVYLPCTGQSDRPQAVASTQPVLEDGRERILLVEDEEGVRRMSRRMLERRGYQVIEAVDADTALRCVTGDGPAADLLLTDVVMPGRSGLDLYAALKLQTPHLKVLFMSGYTDDAIVRKGLLDPGTPFLQKPFTSTTLLKKVREVLDARVM